MTDQSQPLLIKARGLAGIDGPAALLAARGRIQALGGDALGRAEGAVVLDLPLWLCPAPIDAHVHLCLGAKPGKGGKLASNLAAWQTAKVAAVRDLGHPASAAPPEQPAPPPLVIASGRGLGPSWLGEDLKDAADMQKAVRARAGQGARVIKLFASGLLDFHNPGQVEDPLALEPTLMKAAVDAAHGLGLVAAAHASGEQAVSAALAAGVDSIEHGFFLGADTLARMADAGVAWLPTLAAVMAHEKDPQGRHHEATRQNLAEIVKLQIQAMNQGAKLGLNLVAGSDAGSYGLPHGRALFLEIEAWQKAGLDSGLIFQAATSRGAALLGLEDELGSLAVGKRAWLLGLEGDPATDPWLMARPRWSLGI